jgi:hypothetical protein
MRRRGRYRAKNHLDDALWNWIGGKYLHERHQAFRDYLQQGKGFSAKKATQTIEEYKTHGIPGHIAGFMRNELTAWLSERQKRWFHERAIKGSDARWKKSKTAVKHTKTAPKHLKSAPKHSKPAS